MIQKAAAMFAAVSLIVGAAGGFLWKVHRAQRLGTPGVRIVAEPIYDTEGKLVGTNCVQLPNELQGYEVKTWPVAPVETAWLPLDTTYGKRLFRGKDGFEALASVVVMGTDRGSIHKPQICLVGQGWRILKSETAKIRMDEPRPYELEVMRLTASKPYKTSDGTITEARGVYVYWFVADGQLTASHGERMWLMARDMIAKQVLQRWAYISFFSTCRPGYEDATYVRLKDLIAETTPKFQTTAGSGAAPAVSSKTDPRQSESLAAVLESR